MRAWPLSRSFVALCCSTFFSFFFCSGFRSEKVVWRIKRKENSEPYHRILCVICSPFRRKIQIRVLNLLRWLAQSPFLSTAQSVYRNRFTITVENCGQLDINCVYSHQIALSSTIIPDLKTYIYTLVSENTMQWRLHQIREFYERYSTTRMDACITHRSRKFSMKRTRKACATFDQAMTGAKIRCSKKSLVTRRSKESAGVSVPSHA